MTRTAARGRAIRTVFSLALHSALAPTSTTTISQNGVAASTATTAPAIEPSKLPWVSVVMVRPLARRFGDGAFRDRGDGAHDEHHHQQRHCLEPGHSGRQP